MKTPTVILIMFMVFFPIILIAQPPALPIKSDQAPLTGMIALALAGGWYASYKLKRRK